MRFAAILIAALAPAAAQAAETTVYTYDALGRLTKTEHSGTTNAGLVSSYAYDAADNRTSVTVSGSANNFPPGRGVIVLPINGFTIIPL